MFIADPYRGESRLYRTKYLTWVAIAGIIGLYGIRQPFSGTT
jgi:hypothetical protein